MAMEYISGQTAISIKEILFKIWETVKDNFFMGMMWFMTDYG